MVDNSLTPPSETTEEPQKPQGSRPSVLLWSILVLVAFMIGLFTGYLLWQRPLTARVTEAEQKLAALQKTTTANAAASATETAGGAQVEVPQNVKRYNVPVDDDPFLGPKDAPITIVEFSDYQCPFCQRWHDEVFTKLEKTYGDKVRLVYRDFPLYGLHPQAEAAAVAADCAGAQNKYWDYHNLLFSGKQELGRAGFLAYAESLKLNMTDFTKCIDENRYQSEVKADYDFASQLGVRSTPTFFINGLAVVGAQPFEVFQQVIDLELAGKIPNN